MSDQLTAPPIAPTDEANLSLASSIATINLLYAQKELGKRITDVNITTRGLLDIAEHSYKVSGMAKKQEAQEDSSRFVFNIIMGDNPNDTIRIEKTIGGEVLEDNPENLSEAANKLVENLSFADAPEF